MSNVFVAANRMVWCRVVGMWVASMAWLCLGLVGLVCGQVEVPPRLAVPKAEALRAAEKQIREIFQSEFAAAKKAPEKSALAGKLWEHAENTAEDAVARYALLEAARVLAVEADENKLAFNVINTLAAQFEVNELELKAAALVANAKESRAAPSQIEFCELLQTTIEATALEEQFEAASKLVPLLSVSAAKVKEAERRKGFQTRHAELKQLQSQWSAVTKAKATLVTAPDDDAANATYGRYLCLWVGDWKKGLPHLARGSASKLTTIAKQDVGQRATADEQLVLADAWWNLGQSEQGLEKQQLLLRANEWYELSAGELKGLARTKADQRMQLIAKQYPEAVQLQALKRSRSDGSFKVKGFGLSSEKPKPKGGASVAVLGELDRELVPKLLNARAQVAIKTVGQEKLSFLSRGSALPEVAFAITLVSMNVKFVGRDTLPDEDFLKIAKLLNLESLHVHGVKMPEGFWKDFAAVNTLAHLSIVAAGATDAMLATIPKLPRLRTLDLADSTVSDASLGRLAAYPALEFLGVSRTRVTVDGFQLLTDSPLKQLRAESLKLKDADLAVFSKYIQLNELSLGDEALTGEGFRHLQELSSLRRLNLQGVRLSSTGAARIGELASLQSLSFRQVTFDTATFQALCAESRVEFLDVIESTIPESALTQLAAIPALQSINLEGTKITGAGFKGMAPLSSVTAVNLSKTPLDDVGMTHVARAFPNISVLTLNETELTDAGLKPLRKLTSLTSLALGRTRVTLKGLSELEPLARLNTLVIPTKLSPAEVRTTLPRCRTVSSYSR